MLNRPIRLARHWQRSMTDQHLTVHCRSPLLMADSALPRAAPPSVEEVSLRVRFRRRWRRGQAKLCPDPIQGSVVERRMRGAG